MRFLVMCVAVCATVAAGFMGLAGPAAGQADMGLRFLRQTPLALTWAQVEKGKAVRLCNDGRAAAEGLSAKPEDFTFADTGEAPVDTAKVIRATPAERTLEPGQCTDVTIEAAASGTTPSSAKVEGSVTASAPRAGRAVLEVTVTGPAASSLEVPAGKQKIDVTRKRDSASHVYEADLIAPIPAAAGTGDAAAAKLQLPGKILGGVVDGDDIGTVTRTGPWDTKSGVAKLPVTIEGLDGAGTYSGKLNLAGTAESTAAFELDVELKDPLRYAIAVLLAGALLVVAFELWLRRTRVKRPLHKRIEQFEYLYAGDPGLHEEAGNPGPQLPLAFEAPDPERVDAYAEKVREAIDTYGSSTLYFDTTSKPYGKIVDSIALAEKDALHLYSKDGLAASLRDLAQDLVKLAKFVKESEFRADREPAIAVAAAELLHGKELEVGEATTLGERLDEHGELIDTWIGLAKQVLRHQLWAAALAKLDIADPADRQALAKATGRVKEAHNELLEVADEKSLERLGTRRELESGYAALATLGGRHNVWVPPPAADSDSQAEGAGNAAASLTSTEIASVLGPERWMAGTTTTPTAAAAKLVEDAEAATVNPAEAVVLRKSRRWVGDVAVILFGVAVAMVAALDEVYFGKAFGSTEDYVTLLFAGVAGSGIAKAFTGTLVTLRGGSLSPPTESDPKPAG